MELRPVALDFRYASGFAGPTPEADERLLLDALQGDAIHPPRRGGGGLGFHHADPGALGAACRPTTASYAQGSWGPEPAETLLTREGRQWRRP